MGLIGSAAGGLLGGLAGLFAGPAPTYKPTKFNKALDQNVLDERAKRSVGDIAAMQTEGIPDAPAMAETPEQAQASQTALGGASAGATSDALARRSRNLYDRDVTRLKRQAAVDAVGTKERDTETAHKMRTAQDAIANEQIRFERQQEAEQDAARYSVLSNLLQGVGSMVGAGVAQYMKTPDVTGQRTATGAATLGVDTNLGGQSQAVFNYDPSNFGSGVKNVRSGFSLRG